MPFMPGFPRSATTQPICSSGERLFDGLLVDRRDGSKPGAAEDIRHERQQVGIVLDDEDCGALAMLGVPAFSLVSWTRQS